MSPFPTGAAIREGGSGAAAQGVVLLRRGAKVARQRLGHAHRLVAALALHGHQPGHLHAIGRHGLGSLQTQYQAGSITVAPRLSMLLRDWLSLHIRRYDKDIAVFLRKREREAARTPRPRA